ncbi:MAG: nicotinate-nucleotide adenylyltransferase [Parvularculaceae bacterium]|nr:nicotinate-nucleotide adenylyltransferase [Parvularculaceae bacterium]
MIPGRHDSSRIGLLGGSFNPAHEGHREISLVALKRLQLDAVWWLVSPGNPLKEANAYAPYEDRLKAARKVSDHPRIIVSNFEERKGLQYTVDTLETLTALWPQINFVWLMGADSMATFHRWRDWRKIARLAPFAVFNRPGFETAWTSSPAADALAAFRLEPGAASGLAGTEPPAWVFIDEPTNSQSSTAIREKSRKSPG